MIRLQHQFDLRFRFVPRVGLLLFLLPFSPAVSAIAGEGSENAPQKHQEQLLESFVEDFCLNCHNEVDQVGGRELESLLGLPVAENRRAWEQVARKLFVRQMPPVGKLRPEEATYEEVGTALVSMLDEAARQSPNPGHVSTFRRLTRTEYQNAIRDLLDLEIDATALLPEDQESFGFDNITVTKLSPTLMNRYLSAAQKISRLAIGRPMPHLEGETFRVRADQTQEQHVPGLPLGTRGGTLIKYNFPRDGEYEIRVFLARDRNEHVEGLRRPHQLDILLDGRHVETFTIKPPADRNDHTQVDKHLVTRLDVSAGPHEMGVTFPSQGSPLLETLRQPYQARFNVHRHPRQAPAIFQVSITGPYEALTQAEFDPQATPSRRRIFVCMPQSEENAHECAERILSTLMKRAYRRPVTSADLEAPLRLYRQTQREKGFAAGIEAALAAVLVSPHFLFRVETTDEFQGTAEVIKLNDFQLASRMSFFLWSSIPDDELLALAERHELSQSHILEQQVQRMLADKRAEALVTNFASQWLHLKNLESFTPDLRLFPDFDNNLRQALRKETEMLFASVVEEDRSILDLLTSESTFLNERLAKHYGIPNVYGSRFRKVVPAQEHRRGGMLRHGSILAVTSYATRTSPVIRGKWILENVIGLPPPPPPPDVPDLEEQSVDAQLSVRARLAAHRADKVCASCHNLIDPVGFALENFDAVGRWRTTEADEPVDARGSLPDGTMYEGVAGLEEALLERPHWFARTLTEKLMTYALGRGLEHYDAPAVRQIVREAEPENYRFSAVILGIVKSVPFQMKQVP